METDSLCASPPRSEPNEVDVPHEKIRRTMIIMLNVFAVLPLDAYHPGRHIELKDAVPVLSALNRSHGLTDNQIEELGRLLSNWDRIINDAVAASKAKKAATLELSSCNEAARTLKTAQSKKQFLEENIKKVKNAELRKKCEGLIGLEIANTVSEIEKLKDSVRDADLMAQTLKQRIGEAEESMGKANQEWKALEKLLLEINSSLVLNSSD